jgi:hypothetical protein
MTQVISFVQYCVTHPRQVWTVIAVLPYSIFRAVWDNANPKTRGIIQTKNDEEIAASAFFWLTIIGVGAFVGWTIVIFTIAWNMRGWFGFS